LTLNSKKNNIIFFSNVNGVADAYPIKPAKEFKFKWADRVKADYKEAIKQKDLSPHIRRCPGVFDILDQGYIVPMPWDMKVVTSQEHPYGFQWEVANPELAKLFDGGLAGAHTPDGVAKGLPIKPGSLHSVVKLDTPWTVAAPKGLKFVVIPIPYPDSFEFESTHGILDPAKGTQITLQLRWNKTHGEHIIKAGTPMLQLIPLSDKQYNLIVRNATKYDKEWVEKRRYLDSHAFIKSRPLIKKVYESFFEHKLQ